MKSTLHNILKKIYIDKLNKLLFCTVLKSNHIVIKRTHNTATKIGLCIQSTDKIPLRFLMDQRVKRVFYVLKGIQGCISVAGCDRAPYPGRLHVIAWEGTIISTLLLLADERQVRHSHVIDPLAERKAKDTESRFVSIRPVYSCFPSFLSVLRPSPVVWGSLIPMCLRLQDRCVNGGAKGSGLI